MKKMILAPSVLGADFGHLAEQIQAVERGGAQYIHLGVMDGVFVPNISFGMPLIASLRKDSKLTFDVHMMVEEPGRFVDAVADSGADVITVHAEACRDLDRILRQIKGRGLLAGVSLNPGTPVETIRHVLPLVDMVLIMTVNPGLGGQKMIPYTLDKVRQLRTLCEVTRLSLDIQVDGGVTLENVREFAEAGANVIVAGSATFRGDAEANAREFMKILKEYESER